MPPETFPLSERFGPGIRGRERFLAGKKPHGWWWSSLFNLAAASPGYDDFERCAGYYQHAAISGDLHMDGDGIVNFCRTMGVHPAHLRCRTKDAVAPIALVHALMHVARGGQYDPRDRLIAIAALDQEKNKAALFLSRDSGMSSIVARSTQAWRGNRMPKSNEMELCRLDRLLGDFKDVCGGAFADSGLSLIHFTYLRDNIDDRICADRKERDQCEHERLGVSRSMQKIGDALFGGDEYPKALEAIFAYYRKRQARTDLGWDGIRAAFSDRKNPLYPFARHAQKRTVVLETSRVLDFSAMQTAFVDLMRKYVKAEAHIEALKGAIRLNQVSSGELTAIISNPRAHAALMDAYECVILMEDADLDLVRDEVQIGESMKAAWFTVPLNTARSADPALDHPKRTFF